MILIILKILKTGISFRESIYFYNKFYKKLVKLKIIERTYGNTVKKILNKYKHNKILLTDTTLIQNKMGIDDTKYNPQLPKTNKILYITTSKGIP